jgi:flagellar hook assembly protein FlgD
VDYYLFAHDNVLSANSSVSPTSAYSTVRVSVVSTANFSLTNVFNYPNPFGNNGCRFTYILSQLASVKITVFTTTGQKVKTLEATSGQEGGHPGVNRVPWDGRDDASNVLPNDVYFYLVEASNGGKTLRARGKAGVVR